MTQSNQSKSATVTDLLRPNFLTVGTGKAGTTSLHEYLGQHPEIFMSEVKEPHYFVHGYGYEKWDEYLGLFAAGRGKKAIGESSTLYLYREESPAWIKSELGPVKIIIVLRNPAKRAFSLYGWMVREGYEDAPTFAEALLREPERIADPEFPRKALQYYPDYFYFTTGLYTAQVRRYLDTFGADSVRVHLFEDLVKNPLAVCQDLFRFLDVDPNFTPTFGVHNEGRIPASVPLQYWLRSKAQRFPLLPRKFRTRITERLMDRNAQRGSKPIADTALLQELASRFRPDIQQLEDLLHRDLSKWYQPGS